MSDKAADVVICGGGVLGAALAYELAGRGARPLLIESRAIASGASGKAAGLLSPASDARAAGPLGPLWRASLDRRHHELARVLDSEGAAGYGFTESPSLLIAADAAEAKTLRADAADAVAGTLKRFARAAIGSTVPLRAACYARRAPRSSPPPSPKRCSTPPRLAARAFGMDG